MLNLIPNCFKRSTIIIRKGQLMFQKGKTKYKEASSKKLKKRDLSKLAILIQNKIFEISKTKIKLHNSLYNFHK